MIKVIAGEKGTGKTAQLVEDINGQATTDNNIVCIQRGHRLDRLLKYRALSSNDPVLCLSGYLISLGFIL